MKSEDCSGGAWIAQQRGAFTEPRYPDYGKLQGEEKRESEKPKPVPGKGRRHGGRKAAH